MSAAGATAGVDVGGGGVRLRVESDGQRIERQRVGAVPRRGGRIDLPALCTILVSELRQAMAAIDVPGLAGLGIGMTGIPGLVDDAGELFRGLHDQLPLGATVIAGDAVTTHCGALGGASGAVVAAGTGVVTLGTDFGATWNQVDGWGHTLGDEGSGAWIGRHGLQAALRAWDGRPGGSEPLLAAMREHFGEPLDLVGRVYPAASPGHELASFAPAAAEAARGGDPIAMAIWQEAGRRLGAAAVAAVRDLAPVISWGGGLFNAGGLLLEPFRAAVLEALPEADLRTPAGTTLDGALLLAERARAGRVRGHEVLLFAYPTG